MSDAKSLSKKEVDRVLAGIRELVAKHGSQLATEKATKIKQRTISKYLAGEGLPGISFAERLALALGKPRSVFRDEFASETTLDREPARVSTFGGRRDFAEQLAAAKARYRHVRPEAWAAIASASTAQFPADGMLTPEILLSQAQNWELLQSAPRRTEAQVQVEIDAEGPREPPPKPKGKK